jgi:hypothetical protein
MSAREFWYTIENGNLYRISENDGHAYIRKGPQRIKILLSTVEEAQTAFPKELAQANPTILLQENSDAIR